MQVSEIVSVIGLIVSIASAVVAVFAINNTRLQGEKQRSLQERLNSEANKLDSRRLFVTALWDKMINVSDIDPEEPIGPDVRKAVNVLEVVALCWHSGVVDKDMVVMSFGPLYEDLYQKIKRINVVPEKADGTGRSGHDLLSRNRVIDVVQQQIRDILDKRQIAPMT